jgi:large subunit ribosomal protein L1
MKISKKRKEAMAAYDADKSYTLLEAAEIIKKVSSTKFDSSFDMDVRLGVDPRQANQMVRGVASLPHGLGKTVRVLALVTPDKRRKQKQLGLIMLDWTSTLIKFLVVGLILISSLQFPR